MQQINRAVEANDHETMMRALEIITDKYDIPKFSHDALLYLKMFKKCLIEKESDGSELWLDDIKSIAKAVTSEMEKIENSTSELIAFVKLIVC